MSIIAYKFQSPNGSYWYIRADDQRTIDYWKDKRKLIELDDSHARIEAHGAILEECPRCRNGFVEEGDPETGSNKVPCPTCAAHPPAASVELAEA